MIIFLPVCEIYLLLGFFAYLVAVIRFDSLDAILHIHIVHQDSTCFLYCSVVNLSFKAQVASFYVTIIKC